jgi:hypothetical protein
VGIQPVGAELIKADRQTYGRTDLKKLIGGYTEYAKAPKMELLCLLVCYMCILQTSLYLKLRSLPIRPVFVNKLQELFVFVIEILLH